MKTNRISEWIKTPAGNYTIIGLLSIIGIVVVYSLFFIGEEIKVKKEAGEEADTNVNVKDTSFKKNSNIYYVTGKKGDKKIMKEDDFMDFKDNVEQLKDVVDNADSITVKEVNYQRIADSILAANDQKIQYKEVKAKKESYKKLQNKSQYRDDWRKRAEQENDAFFNTPNVTSQNKRINNQNLKTDPEIYAVLFNDQTVSNKERISLRLGQEAIIKGIKYKRNTIFYGFVSFSKNRIYVNVNSINNNLVKLSAYDSQDYGEGIYTDIQFKNLAQSEVTDDIVDDINVNNIPLGSTIKRIFKNKKNVDQITLFNEYKLTLKSK